MLKADTVPTTAPADIELTLKARRYAAEHEAGRLVRFCTRDALEAAIEEAIDLLDRLDAADEDLEDGYDLEKDDGESGIADLDALQVFEAEAFALRFGEEVRP